MNGDPYTKALENLRQQEPPGVLALIGAVSALTVERPGYGLGHAQTWVSVTVSHLAQVAEMTEADALSALRRALAGGYIVERPHPHGWEYRLDWRLVP
jgi:hypothetical protein